MLVCVQASNTELIHKLFSGYKHILFKPLIIFPPTQRMVRCTHTPQTFQLESNGDHLQTCCVNKKFIFSSNHSCIIQMSTYR